MEGCYSPKDLIELAVGVEENGRQVYEFFENNARREELKPVWRLLRDQEVAHAQVFRELLKPCQASFSSAEPSPFLRAIAASCAFSERRLAKAVLAGIEDDADALELGIAMEKDSIFFYATLRDHVVGEAVSVLDQVITEEKKHLLQLSELREKIGPRKKD